MDQVTVCRRLATLREARGVSQKDLAAALGFNNRQTLSDIELGDRNITVEEVLRAAAHLGVSVDYFTDPLQLGGEARFSWRKLPSTNGNLDSFEQLAGGWIATYRHLSKLKGETVNSSLIKVDLHSKSAFEAAATEGDAVSRALELGEVPAARIVEVLESKLDTLVLYVDAQEGVSGACSQLGPLNVILINRKESEGRRNFDIAHELFHLTTWDVMPPDRIEDVTSSSRVEQLANNFASAVLMPDSAVHALRAVSPIPTSDAELIEWIRAGALRFCVSGEAMMWRLKCMGLIPDTTAKRIYSKFRNHLRMDSKGPRPPLFSRRFVEVLGWGIEMGHVSVRRAAQVVGLDIDELGDLFSEHGQKAPFEL